MTHPAIRERDILKTILDYLKLHRIFHYRNNVGAFYGKPNKKGRKQFIRFGVPGMPDIVCVVKGQYIGIEVKCPDEFPSQAQVEFGVSLEKAEGRYLVATKVEDVEKVFRDLDIRYIRCSNCGCMWKYRESRTSATTFLCPKCQRGKV